MSAFFNGKPSLGWLRSAVLFALLAITVLSCLLVSWSSSGRAFGVTVMFHGFAFVFSLPFFMISVVRFSHPDLKFSAHGDAQAFAIGRFGRTLLLAMGLAVFVGFVIGAYVIAHDLTSH